VRLGASLEIIGTPHTMLLVEAPGVPPRVR
jgi:hypothetical protein